MKERLIGAAVLVAIGVWIIPWVLGGRPSAVSSAPQQLELPAAEAPAPMRTQTIILDPEPAPASVVAEQSDVPTLEASNDEAAASAAPPATRTAVAPDTAPQPKAAAPAPKAAAAQPKATAPAPAAAESGEWMVQLGSFGAQENAQRLAERVNVFGFKAQVSTYRAGGRLMHRVRVGPQATRERAEAVASSLNAHGFVAQVVAND